MGEFAGNARYELRGRLGAGAHGSVYRAFDRVERRDVAIKVLKQPHPDMVRRFKSEFRSLADLSHPNLATLHELHTEGDEWFFTMELVEGLPFDQAVHRGSRDLANASGLSVAPATRLAALDGTFLEASSLPRAGGPVRTSTGGSWRDPSRGDRALSRAADEETAEASRDTLADLYLSGSQGQPSSEDWDDSDAAAAARCRPVSTAQPSPVADFGRLRTWLRQLAEAVAWLHGTGRIHRDLKPSNVLVDVNGRVVLLDFGLVVATGAVLGRDALAGTPAYMAPEVCGGEDPSESSDWYSFGATMYVLLTGQFPFTDAALPALWAKQIVEALRPQDVVTGIPEDLASLCIDLLRREPQERPSGGEVVARLGGTQTTHAPEVGVGGALIGRERELEILGGAYARAAAGQLVLTTVEAPSGMGKTRLIEAFATSQRVSGGALVLQSRCYERDGVPYKALDGAIDELHVALSSSIVERAGIEDDLRRIARLFPVLQPNDMLRSTQAEDGDAERTAPRLLRGRFPRGTPEEDSGGPGRARRLAGEALARVFAGIAQRRPVLLVIDDLQWADVDSLHLLRETLEHASASPAALCVVLAMREDARASNPDVRAFLTDVATVLPVAEGRHGSIHLQPFDVEDVRKLAQRVLGTADESLVTALMAESEGSPLLVRELAAWSLQEQAPGRRIEYRELLDRRIADLTDDARRALRLLALAAEPLPLRLLAIGATVDVRTLNTLQQTHLVRTSRTPGSTVGDAVISTFHDRVREAVVSQLGDDERVELHRTLAKAGESSGIVGPEFLAVHLAAAGARADACVQLIRAAERAVDVLAFAQAARYFKTAIELGVIERHADYADALRYAGRGIDAARAYVEASARALERGAGAQARRLRALAVEQYLFSGAYDEGSAVIRSALREVGVDVAQGMGSALARFAWQSIRLQLRGLDFVSRGAGDASAADSCTISLPSDSILKASSSAAELVSAEAERIDLLWMATIGLSMASPLASQSIQKRHLRLALDLGDDYRVARALAVELAFSGLAGGLDERRSQDLSRRGHEVADRCGVPHAKGIVVMSDGGVHWLRGRWPEALECVSRAIDIYESKCRGVTWELDTARIVQTNTLLHMGRLDEFRTLTSALVSDARERGDLYLEIQLLTRGTAFMQVLDGDPVRACEEVDAAIARWTPHGYHVVHFWRLVTKVAAELYLGRPAQAVALLENDDKGLRSSLLLLGQYYRTIHLDLVARANIAAARQEPARARRAMAAANKLVKEKMPWTMAHGHASLGALAFQRGDVASARAHWSLARDRFEAASMAADALACRAALQRVAECDSVVGHESAVERLSALGVADAKRYLEVLLPIGW